MIIKIDGKQVEATRVDVIYEGVDVPGMDDSGQVSLTFTDESAGGDVWVPENQSGDVTNLHTFCVSPHEDLAKLVRKLDPETE